MEKFPCMTKLATNYYKGFLMPDTESKDPENESIRFAMSLAWKDHRHARDQTWRALSMVAVLGAGLAAVDIKYSNLIATTGAGVLVLMGAIFGLWITKNHRNLERRKFIHIMNCEEMLGLHRDD